MTKMTLCCLARARSSAKAAVTSPRLAVHRMQVQRQRRRRSSSRSTSRSRRRSCTSRSSSSARFASALRRRVITLCARRSLCHRKCRRCCRMIGTATATSPARSSSCALTKCIFSSFLSYTGLFSTRHVQVAWLRGENAIPGILVMTSYQVYFEPLNRQELKMGGAVVSFHFCAN